VGERSLVRRMGRAVLLDSDFFEEVEAEPRSIWQAAVVVLLTCAAGSAASAIRGFTPIRIGLDFLEPLVLWLAGGAFSYMVGATFLRGPHTATSYREVLRTTGFAFAPGLLRLCAAIPGGVGFGLMVVGDVWTLVAAIVAVRQALDFTTLRAIGTFAAAYGLMWLSFEGFLFTLPL